MFPFALWCSGSIDKETDKYHWQVSNLWRSIQKRLFTKRKRKQMRTTASQIEIRNIYSGLRAFTGWLKLRAELAAMLACSMHISLLICRKTHDELSELSSTHSQFRNCLLWGLDPQGSRGPSTKKKALAIPANLTREGETRDQDRERAGTARLALNLKTSLMGIKISGDKAFNNH